MKRDILGVTFDDEPSSLLLERVFNKSMERKSEYVVTPNSEMLMSAMSDEELNCALSHAYAAIPDGIGVVYASRIMGSPLRERIPGIDFACALMWLLNERGGSVFFFGARPGVARLAADTVGAQLKNLRIAGTADGFSHTDDELISMINAASPDLLFVCLGSPKQEKWMYRNRAKLNVGVMMGLGGALDVLSGQVRRAPNIMQNLGLEWLYRTVSDPKRIKRAAKLPGVLIAAVKARSSNLRL